MTSKNQQRKLRRKGTDKANAQQVPQHQQFNMKEKFLLGKITDVKTILTKSHIDVKEELARIDRQTEEFVNHQYVTFTKSTEDTLDKLTKKIDILLDIFLDNFPELTSALTEEQIKTLDLEEEKPKKVKKAEVKAK